MQISRIDEAKNDLILSEKDAWVSFLLGFCVVVLSLFLSLSLSLVCVCVCMTLKILVGVFVCLSPPYKQSPPESLYNVAGKVSPSRGNTSRRNC